MGNGAAGRGGGAGGGPRALGNGAAGNAGRAATLAYNVNEHVRNQGGGQWLVGSEILPRTLTDTLHESFCASFQLPAAPLPNAPLPAARRPPPTARHWPATCCPPPLACQGRWQNGPQKSPNRMPHVGVPHCAHPLGHAVVERVRGGESRMMGSTSGCLTDCPIVANVPPLPACRPAIKRKWYEQCVENATSNVRC